MTSQSGHLSGSETGGGLTMSWFFIYELNRPNAGLLAGNPFNLRRSSIVRQTAHRISTHKQGYIERSETETYFV